MVLYYKHSLDWDRTLSPSQRFICYLESRLHNDGTIQTIKHDQFVGSGFQVSTIMWNTTVVTIFEGSLGVSGVASEPRNGHSPSVADGPRSRNLRRRIEMLGTWYIYMWSLSSYLGICGLWGKNSVPPAFFLWVKHRSGHGQHSTAPESLWATSPLRHRLPLTSY